jgi:hypothetical protein
MIALTRYQASLLFRSHRWIPPAVLYVLGVLLLGAAGKTQDPQATLASGLSWSALLLVPCAAWLTRAAVTAEPPEARACVAAAVGPRRAHLAALTGAIGFGAALGVVGVVWESLRVGAAAATPPILVGGLGAAATCLLVGSATGALCNPPIIRRPAAAMLCTTGAVVFALVWGGSPANAAVRSAGYGASATPWPPGVPLVAAAILAAAAWAVTAVAAARRGN